MACNGCDKALDVYFDVFSNVEDAMAAVKVAQRQIYESDKFMAFDTLGTALKALKDARLAVAPHVEAFEAAEAQRRKNTF